MIKTFFHRICVLAYLQIRRIEQYIYGFIYRDRLINKHRKTIYLLGTPEHDNLGDHAIALAEHKFINTFFPEYQIVEVTIESWRKYYFAMKKLTDIEDMFFLTGGGNMGDVYLPDEVLRRVIARSFSNNRVVIFPQTVYFSPNTRGEREINKSRKAYERNKRLLICARERESYEIMSTLFPNCRIECYPDMVFFLTYNKENRHSTEKIGVCLRSDNEGVLNLADKEQIKNTLLMYQTEAFSTCLCSGVSIENREQRIYELLDRLSGYSLVVTDRLHAFILSLIAGTPCIVLPVKSSKIRSTLDWVNNASRVYYASDASKLEEYINLIDNSFERLTIDRMDLHYASLCKSIKTL